MKSGVNNKVFGVILAGGSGSRLWPLSRELFPKQLINITASSGNSLYQNTLLRLQNVLDIKNILTITNIKLVSDIEYQFQEFLKNNNHKENITPNVLIEPISKNTAAAIGASVLYIQKNYCTVSEDPIIIVCPSDHLIDNEKFQKYLIEAIKLADNNKIVTIGIAPDRPHPDYGYLLTEKISNNCLNVKQFIEKPSIEEATELVKQENSYWNSGIYIIKISVILKELEKHSIDLFKSLSNLDYKNNTFDFDLYNDLQEISIDQAVMEKSKNIVLIPADIDWCDLGSWIFVHDRSNKDENKNTIDGNVITLNSNNNLVYSPERLTAAIGVDNLAIVNTEDATLICNLDETHLVKDVYNDLKAQKDSAYLMHKTQLRQWGYHQLLLEEENYKIKNIVIKPGCQSSYHLHEHINKHWTVISGTAKVIIDGQEVILNVAESIDIKLQVKHQIINPGEIDLKIIEIQTGKYLDDEDIVRF